MARRPSQERAWRSRVQRAINAADEIITVSNSSARDIASEFEIGSTRISTIEHGIEQDAFATPMPLPAHLQSKLPPRFALYLGNIEPRKNLVPLVEAFDRPEVKALDLPLVIAGKAAWNSQDSLRVINDSKAVISLGFVTNEERAALMQACEVFVFPSLYEGFGFPVLEALSAGAVVLTSDRGSLEEVAGPSLVLRSLDVDGITEGVVRAVSDSAARARCVSEGRAWSAQYTWDSSIDKHLQTYERVLSR